MKSGYMFFINESSQNFSSHKRKIKIIQSELENIFGDRIYSKKFDYDITINDLIEVFGIINKYIFSNKLDIQNVEITIFSNIPRKEKGSFKYGMNKDEKHLISITKYDKDNIFQVINVLIHEMIHLYDSLFGPLKDVIEISCIDNIDGRQYVDRYDAHGTYFKNWCNKINEYGFNVEERYSMDSKRIMKKVHEDKRISDDFFDANSNIDDEQYRRVKAAYDMLTNCNKDMVYRDAKHWYIQID